MIVIHNDGVGDRGEWMKMMSDCHFRTFENTC